jgi:protein CLEC16A
MSPPSSAPPGFWASLFGAPVPRERFSLEELHHLHDLLLRNPVVTDGNRELVVETLRSIAELMIWGDQHEPRFFDFFLEKGVLGHFNKILLQRANRRGEVAKQVLQTLSILIQNIRCVAPNENIRAT